MTNNHQRRNWQRRWILAEDGRRVTHETGLIVAWQENRAVIDAASNAIASQVIAAAEGGDRHVGARIYRLLTEAEQILKKRNLQ